MDNIIYHFAGNADDLSADDIVHSNVPVVDVARMRRAFESPSVKIPAGLTREQKRALIMAHADQHPVKA